MNMLAMSPSVTAPRLPPRQQAVLLRLAASTAAVREVRQLPLPREVAFRTDVLDSWTAADVPTHKFVCPKREDAIKG